MSYIRILHDLNVLLATQRELIVFQSEDNSILKQYALNSNLNCLKVIQNTIIVGLENGKVRLVKYSTNKEEKSFIEFQAIKGGRVSCFQDVLLGEVFLLTVASSDGDVRIFEISDLLIELDGLENQEVLLEEQLEPVYEFKINCRIVSMGVHL